MRGGIQNQYVNIMNGLVRRGLRVTLFVFEGRGEMVKRLSPEIEVIISSTRCIRKPLNFFSVIVATRELVKAIEERNPDILYSRIPRPKLPLLLAGKITRKKIVLAEGNSPWDIRHKRFSWLKKSIQKVCYRNSDRVLAVSRELASEMESFYGLKEVRCVYNGVDFENVRSGADESPEHPWFGEDIPLVCSVAALIDRKNIHHLLQAVGIAREKTDFRLVIVGEGSLRNQLEKIAADLKVDDIVDFAGYQPNPYAYMGRSDLFILSSRSEGLPNVLLEAMSLGIPTISTDCDYGPREIIEDGKNGILVPVGEPDAIADAMVRLLEDGKLAKAISENALKTSRGFTLEKMVSGYESLFRELAV